MQHRYFAAANSSEGFKNYFPEIFGRADRLYIIKGGPGTGKSSFMKKIAKRAEEMKNEVEYYYCSSDPSSVDGVLMYSEKGAFGIIDGTSPHTYEPYLSGAKDEIINLGSFWDAKLLYKQKNEIEALTRKKNVNFKRAYKYLRSCGNLRAVTDSLIEETVDTEKTRAAASRLAKILSEKQTQKEFLYLPAIRNGISMSGRCSFDSFEKNADKLYLVGDGYGVGNIFFSLLWEELKKTNVKVKVSYDPVCTGRIDGIFVEDTCSAVVLSGGEYEENEDGIDRFINPRRFVIPERLRKVRGEIRYASKLYEASLDGALNSLSNAKVYHFLLEDIYKNAMDFKALDEFCEDFIYDMFK